MYIIILVLIRESQKQSRRGSLHSCECWLLLVGNGVDDDTVELEVLGPVHHVGAVAVVKPELNHLVDNDGVQINDVVKERCVHRALSFTSNGHQPGSVIFVLIYFLVLLFVFVLRTFFSFSFVLVFIIFSRFRCSLSFLVIFRFTFVLVVQYFSFQF